MSEVKKYKERLGDEGDITLYSLVSPILMSYSFVYRGEEPTSGQVIFKQFLYKCVLTSV